MLFSTSFWWVLLLIILWFIITTIGSFHIRWNYFLKAKYKNYQIKENAVALTFDDGPNAEFTPKALQLLKKYNAKATFFCIGKNVEKHPEIIKKIIFEGHILGNHSYAHSSNYGFLSTEKIISDIKLGQEITKNSTGLNLNFFRPPFGVTNPNIAKAIKQLNLKTFGWSIRSYDTTSKKTKKIIRDICSKIQKGDVILLHDTSQRNIDVLEQLLQFLQKNKLKSITLEELFNTEAYEK
ncbi:MAG: polysaccharide deacetylase family protein [Flavobacteriaceae bacterium]|nr:polysaccharide deacetylase family protein [Flavobacteriaceae bacterium]